jgi:hypothetical protein
LKKDPIFSPIIKRKQEKFGKENTKEAKKFREANKTKEVN